MSKPKAVIGIDPGSKGAIVLLSPSTHEVRFLDLGADHPAPVIKEFLDSSVKEFDCLSIAIENVKSLPMASKGTTFSFGYNLGYIQSQLDLLGLTIHRVNPKKWQAYIGIKPKSATIKKDVAAEAIKRYPFARELLYGSRGGLIDGRSDALMIAHYSILLNLV